MIEPASIVLASEVPTEMPVLTASEFEVAIAFCRPRASTTTCVVSREPGTSVARSSAFTVGASVFSVTVPAAAAAIRPKLSAAAFTSALVSDLPSASTVRVLPVVTTDNPVSLPATLSAVLRSTAAYVLLRMVLNALAPPPANDTPMLIDSENAMAVDSASIRASSVARTVMSPTALTRDRSMSADVVLAISLVAVDTPTATEPPNMPNDAETDTANTVESMDEASDASTVMPPSTSMPAPVLLPMNA